jgi:hypothetical protein
MVVLNKIYTRTGDDGTTALGTGERVAKYDLRVEAYGTIDETNAVIGLARTQTRNADPKLGRGSVFSRGDEGRQAELTRERCAGGAVGGGD